MDKNYPPEFDSIPDGVFTKEEVIGFITADRASASRATPVGHAGAMPGTSGFTMACFKAEDVPVGSPLYLTANQAAEAPPVAVEATKAVARVEKHTGSLRDMAIIIWLGEQPPEGTLLYTKEPK